MTSHKLLILCRCAVTFLSLSLGQTAAAADQESATPLLPPLLDVSNAKENPERVLEVQATLNYRLAGRQVALPPGSMISNRLGNNQLAPSQQYFELRIPLEESTSEEPDGYIGLIVRGDTIPEHNPREQSKLTEPFRDTGIGGSPVMKTFSSVTNITLSEEPLKVDGIYAKKTFSAVYIFQLLEYLEPSGSIDAVTLERLEPLVPPNWLLARLMQYPREGFEKSMESYPWIVKQVTAVSMTLLILMASVVAFQIARNLLRSTEFLSHWVFTPTSSPWFGTLMEKRFFLRLAHFVPALFIHFAANVFPRQMDAEHDPFPYLNIFENWHVVVSRLGMAYAAFVCMRVAMAFVDTCDATCNKDKPKNNPIEGIVAAARRIVTFLGVILIAAAIAGKSPMYFVGGLGAITAVVMLVFRDAILGLVASVQIVAQNTVKIGDWIEVPKYHVDGDVISISLTTIKVRNFDKTVTSIPTYSVMSESFKNWRGMQETGGRRIKRHINLDMNFIKPVDVALCERFAIMSLLTDYIQRKRGELRDQFLKHGVVLHPVNARWLTNVGTFRIYVENYLRQHSGINQDLPIIVRQLQPGREGLPIEVYAFTNDTAWVNYEKIQADIFDHLLSVLPEFDLRMFQDPREFQFEHSAERPAHRIDHRVSLGLSHEANGADWKSLQDLIEERNGHLASNGRSSVDSAVRKVAKEIDRLQLSDRASVTISGRRLSLRMVNSQGAETN